MSMTHAFSLDRLTPPASATSTFPHLLDQITVDHGPVALLGRFFLKADAAARDRGVHLSLVPLEVLPETNRRNGDTWLPLLPLFDPGIGGVTEETGIALVGRNDRGEIVATQGARLYDWSDSDLFEEATSLRMFYADPDASRLPGERCEITAPSARRIRGKVVFSGAGWYRPDHRGQLLSGILPRISRALAYTHWRSDYTISMIADAVVAGGMARRAGYTNVEEKGVRLVNSPVAKDASGAVVWMQPEQMLDDLARFLSTFDAQVDAGIEQRRA